MINTFALKAKSYRFFLRERQNKIVSIERRQISATPVRSRQNAPTAKAVGISFVPFFKRNWIERKPISKLKLIKKPCGKDYAAKMRDIFRGGMGNNEQEREASLAKRDSLRTQYESELRTVVPAGDADKIVEAMRRGWPGFFPRRTDGRRGPAGGGD